MVKVKSTYLGDLRTECEHGPSGDKMVTDAPLDNKGKGEKFSPTDLVATAYAACILTIMGIYANHLGVDLTGATCDVEKEMTHTLPRKIAKLTAVVKIPRGFDPEIQSKLEKGAHDCPVHHSLDPSIEKTMVFEWGTA